MYKKFYNCLHEKSKWLIFVPSTDFGLWIADCGIYYHDFAQIIRVIGGSPFRNPNFLSEAKSTFRNRKHIILKIQS
jgi:hypothetical protein